MLERRRRDLGHGPAALAVSLALAFAGCGGDDDSEQSAAPSGGGLPSAAEPQEAAPAGDGEASGDADRSIVESELSPQAQVDLAIKGVLASAVPALACGRYATVRFVKKTFGSRAGCEQSTVPASAASSVKVTAIRIDGQAARAVAVPSGGPSSGERIEVVLVRAGAVWKVDALRSNAPVGP